MKKIVSVQDISCYGQCSLTVALPVLSAYGIETAILPSGILSTHTGGFHSFSYHDLTDEMPVIIRHWMEENIHFDAVYTGYIGDARQFDMICDLKKLLNPGGQLIVDPAMADHGKLYKALNEDIVAGMRSLVRAADLILPNLTEAALLLERPYKEHYTKDEIREMLTALTDLGPETAIITGVSYEEGFIGAAAYNKTTGERSEVFVPAQPVSFHGTGDIFSSVAIAEYLNGKELKDALLEACQFVAESIACTIPDESHRYGVKFEQVLYKRRTQA